MAWPYEIRDRLVSQAVGVYNTNIFIGSSAIVPDGDGPYLQINETGGSGFSRTHNNTATAYVTAQILVRAQSYSAARTMIFAAFNALGGENGLYNFALSGVDYVSLKARGVPADTGKDAKQRATLSFNIEAEKFPA